MAEARAPARRRGLWQLRIDGSEEELQLHDACGRTVAPICAPADLDESIGGGDLGRLLLLLLSIFLQFDDRGAARARHDRDVEYVLCFSPRADAEHGVDGGPDARPGHQ